MLIDPKMVGKKEQVEFQSLRDRSAMMMRTFPCPDWKLETRRKENEACAGKRLGEKIDIRSRKRPIALIDKRAKPRRSGVNFSEKSITTIAKWQVLRKPGGE
jgi:hypothetical protein